MKTISKTNNSLTYFAVFMFLLLAGFFYGKNIPQARADSADVTKYGVVFDGTNGSGTPNYARIIKKEGVYHMWYEDTENKLLYHTTSADGISWARGVQCGGTDNLVHEPSVIWDSEDGIFKMWFESRREGEDGIIRYLESADGIDWGPSRMAIWTVEANTDNNAWENAARYTPYVIKEDGTYKMWYQSSSTIEGEGGNKRINYATSSDGINWDNSGKFDQVSFQGNSENNIVLGLGSSGNWDSTALYSQAIVRLSEDADWNYMMLYAAHDGGIFKIGRAVSDDGIMWLTEDDNIISESHDIWFPSVTEERSEHYVWYMDSTRGDVYFATIPFGSQGDSGSDKAHIDSWKAYQYDNPNQSCSTRLKLIIKGKQFDKDAEVKIGGKVASSVDVQSSKRIVAKFCLTKLLDSNTNHKRKITVKNPDTDAKEADKQINLDNVMPKISADIFNMSTAEGIKNIQKALVKLEYLKQVSVTGIYGPLTKEAVKKFQGDNGIPPTGFVGPLTKAKLQEKIK